MYNIDHFKSLIGAEIEALVTEINDLKKRVAILEHNESFNTNNGGREYIGRWVNQTRKNSFDPTCNTSELI